MHLFGLLIALGTDLLLSCGKLLSAKRELRLIQGKV